MLQQIAPPITVQSFDGLMTAKVCTPEHGCVMTQVMACFRIYADGTWIAAYHDPLDPMRNHQVSGDDASAAKSLAATLAAIASLAPEFP